MNWQLFAFPWDQLAFVFLVLLISFAVHEFAHAWFADQFGDTTPRSMGRLTLNPRSHIDWLGMIFFLLIGIGWAKPVLINRARFKSPRVMGIIVSLAGPLSNLLLAFISMLLLAVLVHFGILASASPGIQSAVNLFLTLMVSLNILLFILNLIPFPPLDGYRILEDLLPRRVMMKIKPYEQWMFYAMLLLFFIPPLRAVTFTPLFSMQYNIFGAFQYIIAVIFGSGI